MKNRYNLKEKLHPGYLLTKYQHLPVTVKVTMWFMVCSILQKAISLITVPVFTRLLSTEQYGQYSIYNSWLQIFMIVCTFRLDYAVFNKGMSKYPRHKNEYTSSMQGLTALLTMIMLCIYLLFQKPINTFTELSTFITLAIFLELFFSPAVSFWSLRERYDFRYKSVVGITLLMAILNPVLGLIAIHFSEDKGTARILSCIIVQTVFGIIFFAYNLKRGKHLINKHFWKFALIFNLPLIPHYFSSYILEQSDRIIIQKLCGIEAVALYSVAYNAGAIIKIVTNSLNNAIIPWQYRKLEQRKLKDLKKTTFQIMLLVAACIMLFILFAPEFMYILASVRYQEAVYVIPPIASSIFFIFMYSIYANIEFYFDANKFTAVISLAGAFLNLILNFICVPLFGYIAASYTSLLCYIVYAILHCLYVKIVVRRKTGQELFDKNMIVLSIGVIILTIIFSLSYLNTVVRYCIIVGLIIILWHERNQIKRIVKVIKKKNNVNEGKV